MTAGEGEGPGVINGADGRLGPGKGTQVVLLRHGMSTFNKLNIFTVSETSKTYVCVFDRAIDGWRW